MQGLRHFMVQSVCNSEGRLVAFMVFGHHDQAPFGNRQPWVSLSETLEAIMYPTVAASRIPDMLAFAEHARLARSQADLVVLLSKVALSVLFGAQPLEPTASPHAIELWRPHEVLADRP